MNFTGSDYGEHIPSDERRVDERPARVAAVDAELRDELERAAHAVEVRLVGDAHARAVAREPHGRKTVRVRGLEDRRCGGGNGAQGVGIAADTTGTTVTTTGSSSTAGTGAGAAGRTGTDDDITGTDDDGITADADIITEEGPRSRRRRAASPSEHAAELGAGPNATASERGYLGACGVWRRNGARCGGSGRYRKLCGGGTDVGYRTPMNNMMIKLRGEVLANIADVELREVREQPRHREREGPAAPHGRARGHLLGAAGVRRLGRKKSKKKKKKKKRGKN
jgi:hypothetical protein